MISFICTVYKTQVSYARAEPSNPTPSYGWVQARCGVGDVDLKRGILPYRHPNNCIIKPLFPLFSSVYSLLNHPRRIPEHCTEWLGCISRNLHLCSRHVLVYKKALNSGTDSLVGHSPRRRIISCLSGRSYLAKGQGDW
jgi:hypothetical protein